MHACIAEIVTRDLLPTPSGRDDDSLQRLRKTGFDTVLWSDADAAPDAVGDVVTRCRAAGLVCWLVIAPDHAGDPVLRADASPPVDPWMVDDEVALDPRRAPSSVRAGPIEHPERVAPAWEAKVEAAVAAGVAGFVCRDADRLPAAFWSRLIASFDGAAAGAGHPLRWIAWTAGLPPDGIHPLVDAGFAMVCASTAWWDGRSRWLVDEAGRLGRVAGLAFPVDPFAPATTTTAEALPFAARMRLAATVADALLVPQSALADSGHAATIAEGVAWFSKREHGATGSAGLRFVSGPDAPVTVVVRTATFDLRAASRVVVALVDPDTARSASVAWESVTTAVGGFGDFTEAIGRTGSEPARLEPGASIDLEAGEVRVFAGVRLPVVKLPVPGGRRSAEAALSKPRVAIEAVTPAVDGGRFPVKRTAGETVAVEADILIDGHEKLGASLLYRTAGDRDWQQVRMEPLGNDRFGASFPLQRVGRHEFTIEAWRDEFATYRNELEKKAAAGLDVSLELTEGAALVDHALAHAKTLKRPDLVRRLTALAKSLPPPASSGSTAIAPVAPSAMAGHVAALLASQTLADLQDADHRAFAHRPEIVFPVDAERTGASFASWYELFPRSLGNEAGAAASAAATHHGTFDDVIDRLPAVRAMGFDVLYFPPIHPIGRTNRKGRNNSLTALDDDPGSPYAIGSADGGHDALHPQLGTFDDFRRLREAALDNGLELALDFAIQCSPDHPWLQQHPGWFAWRPDGSLRYAENPPKKYEDIVNVDFYGNGRDGGRGDDAPPALWAALRDVILLWVEQGVRIFRVDNPHTKPLPFWEWMIGEVRARYPDTIFLSEAFTRPKVMYRLAKVGFSQSYTYFTWRHTKQEFIDYLTELTVSTDPNPRDFFRPNFFVNTPDINPVFLQRSGRAGFLIRAALAATLSGLWGVYAGFELCEATPVPGKEDYLDSEKYQLRAWDWQRPGHIIAEITALNRIRNENPALRTHLNVRFQEVYDPNILYFVKATADRSNVVLVAINLDPFGAHEADFELPLWQWGRADDATVDVTDLLDGHRFRWQGKTQRMRLDPSRNPYAIWRVAL